MRQRTVVEQLHARHATDGDGVNLLRVFGGGTTLRRFDPFLMLDEFGSDEPSDYRGGFPAHPHRGFETVTYMLTGQMEHRDHMGNVGLLSDGGVQWMTAGRGVIHSEMPRQTEGRMHGLQLWVNLAAADKMQAASYRDVPARDIPVYEWPGVTVTAIAGEATVGGEPVIGYFDIPRTEVLYLDIALEAETEINATFDSRLNALAYVYQGDILIGEEPTAAAAHTLNHLGDGDALTLNNPRGNPARLVLFAGIPLAEPIVQHGPFVMNSQAEIEKALQDYRDGTLTGADQ